MRQALIFSSLLLLSISTLSKLPTEGLKLTKGSFDGDGYSIEAPLQETPHFTQNFHFTDSRMQASQAEYETKIRNAIISEISSNKNLTEAAQKYPHDSPVFLTILSKFAYHLLIDEYGLSLYTYSYDLGLNSCGVQVLNLKTVHIEQKKGEFLNLQSIPSDKYKLIIGKMIKDSARFTSGVIQEKPLFITVHPSLTFFPAASIEDKLHNLRVDFPQSEVRYCKNCNNILSFDEYAYLSWLTINAKTTENSTFFKPGDHEVINFGLSADAIFTSYPLDIEASTNSSMKDRIGVHEYCLEKEGHADAFVQNVYYSRSLNKFTSDFLSYITRESADKQDNLSLQVQAKFACYPKNYKQKLGSFLIFGTGNFEECKTQIRSFLQKNYVKSENSQLFDLPAYDIPLPLEGYKESKALSEAALYIESDVLEDLFEVAVDKKKYKAVKLGELDGKIKHHCTSFLNEQDASNEILSEDNLNSCIHLIYSEALLNKIGIPKEKELRLRNTNNLVGDLLKGVTMQNLEKFHSLEKEWFFSTQDRTLESYFTVLKETRELDRLMSFNRTVILVGVLALTFWAGFIVRFGSKKKVSNPTHDDKKK